MHTNYVLFNCGIRIMLRGESERLAGDFAEMTSITQLHATVTDILRYMI